MYIPEVFEECDDISEFEDRCEELLDQLCEELKAAGETTPVRDDYDVKDYDFQFWWTDKASRQIDAEISRLYAIGRKYFGEDADLTISTNMYREL